MKKFKLICIGLMVSVILCVIALGVNTFNSTSKQIKVDPVAVITIDTSVMQHLSDAIKIKTVSSDAGRSDTAAVKQFHLFLDKTFPLITAKLEKIVINEYSLLYIWKGSDTTLKPNIYLAHMDVVPTESEQEKHAFSGDVQEGFIWGRGTLDDKGSVMGLMESVNGLLKQHFQPHRTVILAFGHDEELGGQNGAKQIAKFLYEKKIGANMILDEGGLITDGVVPGIQKPVAVIGIAEKGYVSVKLSVLFDGGHSSMPGKENTIGILSGAIKKLEDHPMEAQISKPVSKFLDYIGPEMPFFKKMAIANRWLLDKQIIRSYENTSSGNALMRTTIVPTIVHAGVKDNILPQQGNIVLNCRILPGETIADILDYIKKTIDDNRIIVEIYGNSWDPVPISPVDSVYKSLEKTIRQIFPSTIVAPTLTIAGTDSKHYTSISKNIYRFSPIVFNEQDLKRFHGKQERISTEAYKNVIKFYVQLIKNQ